MADRVAIETNVNQERRKILHLYSVSDGTGESAVVKISKAGLNMPNSKPILINRIWGVAVGMTVNLLWDASADDLLITFPDSNPVDFTFDKAPAKDPQSATNVGDLLLTTVGHTSGDTYSIWIDFSW